MFLADLQVADPARPAHPTHDRRVRLLPARRGRALARRIDYAQIVKDYGDAAGDEARQLLARDLHRASTKHVIVRRPRRVATISNSYVERQNLTMRMGMRRFTRLTNAFSKKVENHAHAVSLHFMHYNFCPPAQDAHQEDGRADHARDGRGGRDSPVVAHSDRRTTGDSN